MSDEIEDNKREDSEASENDDEEEDEVVSFFENLRMIIGALAIALFIRAVFFEPFAIQGPSMEPTLQNGDRVLVSKVLYGLVLPGMEEAILTWGEPNAGDVVILNSPADQKNIVKRVIGVPGDVIEVRGQTIYRNGEPLPQEDLGECNEELQQEVSDGCRIYEESIGDRSYFISDGDGFIRSTGRPVEVPEGHVFVRGDHRDQSNDSTNPSIGAVPISRIKGRALTVYLSCEDDPSTFWICDEPRWDRFFSSVR